MIPAVLVGIVRSGDLRSGAQRLNQRYYAQTHGKFAVYGMVIAYPLVKCQSIVGEIIMRPSKDEYFMSIAQLVSTRSTCYKKHVGCVLVDCHGHILSTGYNGAPSGVAHCTDGDGACPNRFVNDEARRLRCKAIHAEANAILQCRTRDLIHIAYCTLLPCFSCLKLLASTNCHLIVYANQRSHPELPHEYLIDFWVKSKRGRAFFCQPISQL